MKIKVLAGALLAVAVPLLALIPVAGAQTFRSDQSVNISSDDVIDGSAYLAGSSIDVSGKVNGDLYCAGQNVTISGEVTGDVLCVGQTLTISGTVGGNVRIAGQTMAIGGTIGKGASIAGQTITLHKDGQIGQDATIVGQNTNIDGQVGRDLVLSSVTSNINSAIGRNVTADIETLNLAKGTVIGGTLNYTAPQKLTSSEGSTVAGKVTYIETKEEAKEAKSAFNPLAAIIWSLMLLVSALILVLVIPRLLHNATQPTVESASKALLTILVGFVAGIVMPVAILLLMLTVLGIPFAIVTLVAWTLIVILSGAFAAYYLGRVVWRTQSNAILTMLVGALIIVIGLMLPIINVLIWLIAVWYGTGAILAHLQKLLPAPQYDMSKQSARTKK